MPETAEQQQARIAAAHRAAQEAQRAAKAPTKPQWTEQAMSAVREGYSDPPSRPTREGREGDTQPLPTASNTPIMHELVQADLAERLRVGIERYGQPLQAFNGRNALRDAYEEVLDLAVYLRQAIYEQEHPR